MVYSCFSGTMNITPNITTIFLVQQRDGKTLSPLSINDKFTRICHDKLS